MSKKSIFETPLLSTKIKSANAKIFPEGGLGYFVGPTFALIANSVLSSYFTQYMTDVLNMNIWASTFLTLLPIISVVFVVLGNILVGRLMDHSRTKAGKARPLLLLSVPCSLLALLILFIFSPFSTDTINTAAQTATLICIAIGYNLWFAVAYPMYYTPHAALVNLSTRNSKDRSLLATISNATALAAMGLCSMVLPFFLKIFLFIENDDGSINQQASYNGWKIFVIILIAINFIGVLIEYYFTRERVTEESFVNASAVQSKKAAPISMQFKICAKDKFWWIMMFFFVLYQFGGMLKNVSQIVFCKAMWYDDYNSMHGTLSIIGAVPTALGMLIAWPLSNKIGKGRAICFGAILSAIGGAIGFIAPDNFTVVVVSFCVKALGSTPAMYLSLAMLADILDHQEALHGMRTDGLTMTIYGAVMAGMTGIVTGILVATESACGYDANSVSTITSDTMQTAMTWLFIGGETICYAVIAIMFAFMGVEKFSAFDHKAITADQKAQAEADGIEYISPAEKLKTEEAEAEAASEEARKAELKAKCEKKGLNFEQEEAKYEAARDEKQKAAEQKKAVAEAKKAKAEKQKQAKYDALSDEEKKSIEQKQAQKAEKTAKRNAETLKEFNALRVSNGRTALDD